MRVSITTLGCKSNQYDSSAIEDILRQNNFEIASSSASADVFIVNTCTVTGKADYQSRQLIRRAKAENPDAIIVVTGCYAQVTAQEVAQIEGVDYIIGNPEKGKILQYINEGKRKSPRIEIGVVSSERSLGLRAKGSSGRTRSYLKVQDGCNNSCSYCIIPKARGVSRSLPVPEILQEIESLVADGYKEIILTGIHLGAYGLDLTVKGNRQSGHSANIAILIREIDRRNYPCRFRISSLDPDEVSDELIEIIADSRTICNHLHLPLQSGDDNVLQRMNRLCIGRLFAEQVEKIAKMIPDVSIGVDIIAGFPGEGEKEFSNTYNLLNNLPISYMHIFPFSKRKGTLAADFPDQVEAKGIKERCERLRALDKIMRRRFCKKFIGKSLSVLVEASRDKETGFFMGRSKNYIPFLVKDDDAVENQEIDVVGIEIRNNKVLGTCLLDS